jgi:hypothetical protein
MAQYLETIIKIMEIVKTFESIWKSLISLNPEYLLGQILHKNRHKNYQTSNVRIT